MTTVLIVLAIFGIVFAVLYIIAGLCHMAARAIRWCWSRLAPG
jgi:hypothetical protein